MFATLSMVAVSLNLDGGVVFITVAFESVDGDSLYKPRWWGCIYDFVLRQKHGDSVTW